MSKKGAGKLEVELTVKSKSGQNVTQVDETVIPKNINVSGLSDNNSSPITVAFDSVKVTPSVPDDASEIDITEQFAGSNLKMAIVRKNNPDQVRMLTLLNRTAICTFPLRSLQLSASNTRSASQL